MGGIRPASLNQWGFAVVPREPRSYHYYQTSLVVLVFWGACLDGARAAGM
jgi:hypothetical protein